MVSTGSTLKTKEAQVVFTFELACKTAQLLERDIVEAAHYIV